MLKNIMDTVMNALREGGVSPLYSAFDAQPLERKTKGIFTVAGLGRAESSAPVYCGTSLYFPFRAEAEVCVTAPQDMPLEKLLGYYSEKIQPVLANFPGSGLKSLTARLNTNIGRLTLTAVVGITGVYKAERSE
ncbi:MAG: hypothetical protein IKQ90_03175 [Ruminococcus sp.]|nr:hypothetical protein [Ruminococcus sp.]